jgi:phosphate-selective porin OprO/OprP
MNADRQAAQSECRARGARWRCWLPALLAIGLAVDNSQTLRAAPPAMINPMSPPRLVSPAAPPTALLPVSATSAVAETDVMPVERLPPIAAFDPCMTASTHAGRTLVENVEKRLADLKRPAGAMAQPQQNVAALPSELPMIPAADKLPAGITPDAPRGGRGRPGETLSAAFVTEQPQTLPAPLAADVESLRGELRRTIERLDAAEQELRTTRQMPQATDAAPQNGGQPDRLLNLETAFDRFQDQLASEQSAKFPSARLTGFTQLDTYTISQDPLNKATVGDAQNGVGFRRARLAVVGNVAAFTAYMMEVDFATAGRPSFFDMWVEQDNLPLLGALRVGQYLQPFSVDAMSGFRHLPFLERSLPFLAFVPFRRVGAMSSVNTSDERTYLAYSIFRTGGFNDAPEGDSRFATDIGDQGGFSFSTRATTLLEYDPIAEDRYLWHIGASYNYSRMTGNTASGAQPFYQARTGPEFGPIGDGIDTIPATFGPASYASANFTPPNFVDSGRYLADSFNLLGVETVYQRGAFSAQSEFMATGVNSVAGPIWYTGAYGEVMYRLTGEHRGYDKRLASLKNPVPFTNFISLRPGGVKGWGAFEIAARLSYVELRNPAKLTPADYIASTNSSGNGTLTDSTLGMTWWLNYHTKVQFNWIHAMLNNTAKGYSLADSFVTRLQVDF